VSFNLSTEPGALSPILSETLLLVRRGMGNHEIAEQLGVSVIAIETRIRRMRAVGVAIQSNRTSADNHRRKSDAGKKGMASRWGKRG
jgi:DNA-binding NarL/FixJ family response regulator